MSLLIQSISLEDFRNYRRFELADIGALTVIVGRNAVGKTNIIEAVQLLTALSSFRHPPAEHLVRQGAVRAAAGARLAGDGRQLEVSLSVEEGKKRYRLNDKPKRVVDLRGLVPAVAFTPDDLDLVKGGHAGRRQALDALGFQLSANHHVIKRDYEQVIRHKTRLLKDEAPDDLLASIDEMVVTCGAQLACYRAALFAKYAPLVCERYRSIAGRDEELFLAYVPSWEEHDPSQMRTFEFGREEARARLKAALEQRRGEERSRHRALAGPHADKVEFFIDGRNATSFGSQGQQRSIVLACKLAEVALIEDMLQQRPILLLDDVMSELDAARRAELVHFVEGGMQTFITTTNLSYFEGSAFSHARIVRLPQDGQAGREGVAQ